VVHALRVVSRKAKRFAEGAELGRATQRKKRRGSRMFLIQNPSPEGRGRGGVRHFERVNFVMIRMSSSYPFRCITHPASSCTLTDTTFQEAAITHMKNLSALTALCTALALAGCAATPRQRPTEQGQDRRTIAPTVVTGDIQGQAELAEPIVYSEDSTSLPLLIVPMVMINDKGWFEDKDPYARADDAVGRWEAAASSFTSTTSDQSASKSGSRPESKSLFRFSYDRTQVRWHNAIARDLATGQEWLFLNRRGVISRFEVMQEFVLTDSHRITATKPWGMLYLATTDDTNADGVLDRFDARVAMLTDPDGHNPRAITPANMQVVGLRMLINQPILLLTVRRDTNADKRFDSGDDSEPYFIDLRTLDRVARPLLSDDSKQAAERLLK
jgi:hypothetical protein